MIFDGAFFSVVAWIITAPAMYLLMTRDTSKSLKSVYRDGIVFFMGYGTAMFHWFIYLYPLEFTGMTKPAAVAVVLVAWIGLPLLQSLILAFQFVIFIRMKRMDFISSHKYIQPFILASLWIIFEWTQTLTWAGVPWSKLAMSQLGLIQSAQTVSLFGSYLLSFLIVLSGSFIALIYINIKQKKKLSAIVCGVTAVLIFSSNLICGAVLYNSYDDTGRSVRVAAIQGNINSSDKWGSDKLAKIFNVLYTLSHEAADDGAELIVWSETSIPHTLNLDMSTINFLKNLAYETNCEYLIGVFTNDYDKWGDTQSYNSIVYAEKNGTLHYGRGEPYHKRHLVPFGEYLPLKTIIEFFIPPLAELRMYDSTIIEGTESRIHSTESGKIGSLVCFDSIYEELARKSVKDGAEILAISTNDSWFYDSAAVYQHNRHACLRAIETGRYIIRSANTGISSIITPTGEIAEMLEPLVEGYVIGDVKLRDNITLYVHVGNLIVWCAMGFIAVLFAISALDGKIKNKKL